MNISEKDLLKSMVENIDELPDIKKGEFLGYAKCIQDMKKRDMPKKIVKEAR